MTDCIIITVRFKDCDMYGHVNHTVYLTYLEEARIHFLKTKAAPLPKLMEDGYFLFVKRIEIDYKRPVKMGDELEIETELCRLRRMSGLFHQRIFHKKELVIEASVKWACTDSSGKPAILPGFLKKLSTGSEK